MEYIASLDAALLLVPPEWAWSLHGGEGVCAGVELVRPEIETPDGEVDASNAPTTALCLCIAALKARALSPPSPLSNPE